MASSQCVNGHDYTPENTRLVVQGSYTRKVCRKCAAASARRSTKRFRERDPEGYKQASRNRQVKAKYGITWEERQALLAEQGNKCANPACPNTEPGGQWNEWHIDHDHKTGEVRGLLCNGCNVALGILDDSPTRIRGLADYLDTGHGKLHTEHPTSDNGVG